MRWWPPLVILLFLLLFLLSSLGLFDQRRTTPAPFEPADVSTMETLHHTLLSTAAETAVVNGEPVRLEAFLSRDFMPHAYTSGERRREDRDSLSALVRVRRTEPRSVEESPYADQPMTAHLESTMEYAPNSYTIDKVWLIFEDEVWSPPLQPTDYYGPAFRAQRGPKWCSGRGVDVVAQVVGGDGRTHLLMVLDQLIMRTE